MSVMSVVQSERQFYSAVEIRACVTIPLTRQGLEGKGGETGDRVAGLDEPENEKYLGLMTPENSSTVEIRIELETAGTIWTEERGRGLELVGEHDTEGPGWKLVGR